MKKMVKMLQGGRTAAPARTRAEKRARGRQRRRRVLTKLNQSKSLYLFLIPAIVYFIIFCYLPMYGVQIAFKYYSPRLGIWGSTWTGMENLNRFFDSYYFWRLLRNTVGLSLYNLIVAFPFPILLALVFNEVKSPKLKKAVQTISYAPHFISVVVLVGMRNLPRRTASGRLSRPYTPGCKAEARRRRKTEKNAAWDGARCTRHGKNKKEGKHNVYRDCKKGRNGASV